MRARKWTMQYEDGEVRILSQEQAREVMRDLFNCDEDDCEPRAMTDGFNQIDPVEET